MWLNAKLNTATAIPDDYVPSDAVVERFTRLEYARFGATVPFDSLPEATQRHWLYVSRLTLEAALAAIKREGEG